VRLVGVALAAFSCVQWGGVFRSVVIPVIISSLVGFTVAYLLHVGILWTFHRTQAHGRVARNFRIARIVSATGWPWATGCKTPTRPWA
jgi:inorganic phosphate transporter, PiT family